MPWSRILHRLLIRCFRNCGNREHRLIMRWLVLGCGSIPMSRGNYRPVLAWPCRRNWERTVVGHFVLHTYRSWKADHPPGYVKRGQRGILAADPRLARARDCLASGPPVVWDGLQEHLLLTSAKEICQKESWRLPGIAITETHVHAVISTYQKSEPQRLQTRIKQHLGKCLGQGTGQAGKRRFSRGGAPTRVKDSKHLNYLLRAYLPQPGGRFWSEGMAGPSTSPSTT